MPVVYQITVAVQPDLVPEIVRLRRFLKAARRRYGLHCTRVEQLSEIIESQESDCPLCRGKGFEIVYSPVTDSERFRTCPFCVARKVDQKMNIEIPREGIEEIACEVFESMNILPAA